MEAEVQDAKAGVAARCVSTAADWVATLAGVSEASAAAICARNAAFVVPGAVPLIVRCFVVEEPHGDVR